MLLVDPKSLDALLLEKFEPGPERGGLILNDGTVVELANICDKPDEGFVPNVDDLIPHIAALAATWHTHPGMTANLSVEDWETFIQWPQQLHAIVGSDGVRWYRVAKNAVINA